MADSVQRAQSVVNALMGVKEPEKGPPTLGQRVWEHFPGASSIAAGLASPQGQIMMGMMPGPKAPRQFWHGTPGEPFKTFKASERATDTLGPASYLTEHKAGAQTYADQGGKGNVLGPFKVNGNMVELDTHIPWRFNPDGSVAKTAPARAVLSSLERDLIQGRREPWGEGMSSAEYTREYMKRRGVDAVDSGAGAEVAVYNPANILDWDTPLDGPPRIDNPIKAYHGSPHDFDKFDASKIGTGEGAQAYGHGLYFAEAEGTAKSYRDQLAGPPNWGGQKFDQNNPRMVAGQALDDYKGDVARAHADLATAAKEAMAAGDTALADIMQKAIAHLSDGAAILPQASGKMYEVALHAEPQQFLDWDAPLSQQLPAAQETLSALFDKQNVPQGVRAIAQNNPLGDAMLTLGFNSAKGPDVSSALREAGIPGIRYKDQLSRQPEYMLDGQPIPSGHAAELAASAIGSSGSHEAALAYLQSGGSRFNKVTDPKAAAEAAELIKAGRVTAPPGTHNYVVFPGNEHLIEILKKYGIAGLLAGGAALPNTGGEQ